MFGRTLVDRANVKQFCGNVWRNIRFYMLAVNLPHAAQYPRHLQHSSSSSSSSNKQQPTTDKRQTTATSTLSFVGSSNRASYCCVGVPQGAAAAAEAVAAATAEEAATSVAATLALATVADCAELLLTVYRALQQRQLSLDNVSLFMLHFPFPSPPSACYICQSVSRQRPRGIVALSAHSAIFISCIHMAHIC